MPVVMPSGASARSVETYIINPLAALPGFTGSSICAKPGDEEVLMGPDAPHEGEEVLGVGE